MLKIINLSLLTKDIPERFDISQYSTEPQIGFNVTDAKLGSNVSARIYAVKPSGFKVYSACTISNNIIRFTPTTQMFAEVGVTKMQLQITVSNKLLYSFLIYANVTPNIIDDSAIESQDEFTALQQAISTLGQYNGRLQTLEDHTVKDNKNGSINGNLSLSGSLTSETTITAKGGILRVSNLGTTTNPYETLAFTNSFGTSAYIRAYDGDENGSALLVRSGGPLILGGGEYASSRYAVGDIQITSNESTYLGADGQVFIEPGGNTIENRKTFTFSSSGNILTNHSLGIYSQTRNIDDGNRFAVFVTTGTNLWIGKGQTSDAYAHLGYLMLSTGVNPDQNQPIGNKTIFVSVATAGNRQSGTTPYVTAATNYGVFHEGYLDISKVTNGVLNVANGGTGSTGYGSEIYNVHGNTDIAEKTIPSGTAWNNLGSFTLPDIGVYLVMIHCNFGSNNTGRRAINLSETSGGTNIANMFSNTVNAVQGNATPVKLVNFIKATKANQVIYLNAAQNSGSALSVSTRVACIRLK